MVVILVLQKTQKTQSVYTWSWLDGNTNKAQHAKH